MNFSLEALFKSQEDASGELLPQRSLLRLLKDLGLIILFFLWLMWGLSLLSYHPADPAWSTSGGFQHGFHNLLGAWGALIADVSYFVWGYSVWWLVLWIGTLIYRVIRPLFVSVVLAPHLEDRPSSFFASMQWRIAVRIVGLVLLLMASVSLEWTRWYRLDDYLPDQAGGLLGQLLGVEVQSLLGFNGSAWALLVVILCAASWAFCFSWRQTAESIGLYVMNRWQKHQHRKEVQEDVRLGQEALKERMQEALHVDDIALPSLQEADVGQEPEKEPEPAAISVLIEPTVTSVPQSARVAKESQQALFAELPDSSLPQVGLLDKVAQQQEGISPASLEMTSRLIEKKLKDFGVDVKVVAAAPGPVITRYEIEPATGVKGAQIVNLARDLARSLSLVSIRVIETIPGKNYMALELPNAKRQTIRLSEILGSQAYNEAKSILSMGLGKDIIGAPVVVDLAKMPHCLVAGTTGSGKSVGINAMILSLLYKADPAKVRLLLIDPKMLEMSVYEGIPHLLAPVVTDMRQAAHGLNWCVAEMEKRYKLMSKMGVRNIAGYNSKLQEAASRGQIIGNPFSLTPDDPEPLQALPYIVVVIDELADLMMVVGKKIEELIARLAQKARAAGIHLILATQRPSVDVITGLIKANIPTRIAFQVSSKIDSRTILDQMGAESLLGMGDMLYLPAGSGFPQRVHGAFVSDEEVHRVVSYLKEKSGPNYIEGVLEGAAGQGAEGGLSLSEEGEQDPMYDAAVAIVLKNRKASISLVQRHLKIGYNRAARLLEEMENAGLVSAMSHNGQREILVPDQAGDAS